METFNQPLPTNKGEAQQYAIYFQNWASEQDLSYSEIVQWNIVFQILADKHGLLDEFKENGII